MDKIRLSKNIVLDCLSSALIIDNNAQNIVPLDNLEFQVLKYLVEHKEVVVTKDELLALWPSRVVMDHSLARVMSILRKKLGDSSKNPTFIKTLNRQGYLYIGLNSAATDTQIASEKIKRSIPILPLIFAVSLLLLLSTIWYFSSDSRPNEQFIYQTEIIVDPDTQKQDLSINQSGSHLAYSARTLGQEYWFLRVKSLRTNSVIDHKIDDVNTSHPIWLDDNTLVFQHKSENECSIKKISLLPTGQLSDVSNITSCNRNSASQTMAALTNSSVLVAEVSPLNGRSLIHLLDIASGKKSVIEQSENDDSEIYFLQTSPDRKHLVTLSTANWFSTTIKLYDIDDFKNEIWRKEIKNILYTVALTNEKLTYINEYGGVSVSYFNSNQVESLNAIFTSKVYSPMAHENNIFLLEGLYASTNLTLVNFLTNKVKDISHFNGANMTLPKQVNNKKFLFVSNQSGKNQLWLASIDSGEAKQLTVLDRSYNISSYDVDGLLNRIAMTTQFGVLVLNKENNGQYKVLTSIPDAQDPVIYEGLLFYTKIRSDGTDIYQYDLLTQVEQLYIKDGYKLVQDAGYFYYIKYFQPGIWRVSINDKNHFFETPLESLTLEQWYIKDGDLYLLNESQMIKYNLEQQTLQSFENIQCSEPEVWRTNSCINIQDAPRANRIIKISKKRLPKGK
ncbi:winged helix-turn-helix domain-containing protein [Colwellia sp. 6M3]|jgi:DNA-binding winged helix-turn-helix (wHTH) protein|uniref:winged helix-turn-helix domain-containing protein n=1 Tax=Colwellia sp. 6M3 TaxID=2759849 RepID=UPI0015F736C9|nr:winged helix-turn-helix domain-containing protein [Colwellia sp. 6M3]MBA6416544.1 winged helix-turn-helix domain-containing protein [Colwellia sp. 6M3]